MTSSVSSSSKSVTFAGLWLASALITGPDVASQMLSVLGVVSRRWLDCARDVTIVLVVAALHIRLTLLLGHDLLSC
jgi:hypothetical protein